MPGLLHPGDRNFVVAVDSVVVRRGRSIRRLFDHLDVKASMEPATAFDEEDGASATVETGMFMRCTLLLSSRGRPPCAGVIAVATMRRRAANAAMRPVKRAIAEHHEWKFWWFWCLREGVSSLCRAWLLWVIFIGGRKERCV